MSVITTVAMDHAHILGDTIAKIATHINVPTTGLNLR